ncbi:LysR family transcriptional regulator [Alkalilimnicola ehrlichii]|uniref:LysR family transcriptional regulator n=1 Tax=Alkalilimnicola ehrlichii TaxID=351052 RepID=A0A3E0WT74_9GAMM|nr:LysR substrate-binding domain-containing protein [Alkalilimnicola ehrlichii]RFA27177.1 LysR family transcriptional regulator [Alkalilimnicola ehrlichii]RFA35351.1 LysR family transcriptional regulator [Alkalilimnicola ehrlichii]
MLNLNDLRLFVRAVDSGGFAAAARAIGSPKSTISKRVAELEAELGARLIHRTSRSFTLTELGREFYEHARAAILESETAEDVVRRRMAEPSGSVKITASVPVAQFQIANKLPGLIGAYPKVQVQLHVTDRFVDLIHEGFDLAVRSHFAPLPDSGLIQRRLSVETIILVAAPEYVRRCGLPRVPQELAAHDAVNTGPAAGVWRLRNQADEEVQVSPRPVLCADEAGVLLHAAKAGLGIVCLPDAIAQPGLDSGELVAVLPGWHAGVVTTSILSSHRRGQLPAVRAVMDFLTQP